MISKCNDDELARHLWILRAVTESLAGSLTVEGAVRPREIVEPLPVSQLSECPRIEPAFVSELFTDVTRHMPKKKAALECYASQINHAPLHQLKPLWRLLDLGSVAARMDATTLKVQGRANRRLKRLLESELKIGKRTGELRCPLSHLKRPLPS
jgi:hypothetical protein